MKRVRRRTSRRRARRGGKHPARDRHGLREVFSVYANLEVWRRSLAHVKLVVRWRARRDSTGRCEARAIFIMAGRDRADALSTLLHELTHLAVGIGHGHDALWRRRFLEAVHELTGFSPPPVRADQAACDVAAGEALATVELRARTARQQPRAGTGPRSRKRAGR